jgi:GT2 family glycosyltransferase
MSIGIVTYNHARMIEETLRSILTNLPSIPVRVLVLDNCSTDHSYGIACEVAKSDPRLVVFRNSTNQGFGRANNKILQQVDSTLHVFCNPDIKVTAGALDALISFLREHTDVAIVCPRVQFEDGRLQPLNRRHPTVWDLFLRRFVPNRFKACFVKRMQYYEMLDVGYERSCDVPFVSGAFMVCRTETLKAVGGFDPRYFLYFEDADLSRTMQKRGWRTVYCPGATVVHGWQRDAHRSWRVMVIFCVSAFRYFNKWGWRLF